MIVKSTKVVNKDAFTRFLEIIPGFLAWSILLIPFIAAPYFPVAVAYFILSFNFLWFMKAANIMRHMINGFRQMWRNMKINWLESCQEVSSNPDEYLKKLESRYVETKSLLDLRDSQEISNLSHNWSVIKKWEDIYHAVFVTNCFEDFEVTEEAYKALFECNYPREKLIVVSCGEKRDEEGFLKVKAEIENIYKDAFLDLKFYIHEDMPGDVIGKGPNLYSAGHKFWDYLQKKHPEIAPDNVMVTTLDADHVVHKEYFSRITYKYIVDPNRDHKTYQPIPLLFNNIWDAPSPSRVLAVASSFWQIIESMRPYRMRTFASHTQSLQTLLVTDFWSSKTIVEDGHQYWRTYFAYNGDHEMVPVLIPVYHDTVVADSFWETLVNQYKQRRRWAWGISDFPYIVKKFSKHPEIKFGQKFLQTYRHLAGSVSWSTSSFLLAFTWIPLLFNSEFQDTVLAHNVSSYSSVMLNLAWVAVFANVWIYFLLLPPMPDRYKKTRFIRYFSMVFQWVIAPFVSIFFSSLPALDSQTRLMFGQSLNVFWVTPKGKKKFK